MVIPPPFQPMPRCRCVEDDDECVVAHGCMCVCACAIVCVLCVIVDVMAYVSEKCVLRVLCVGSLLSVSLTALSLTHSLSLVPFCPAPSPPTPPRPLFSPAATTTSSAEKRHAFPVETPGIASVPRSEWCGRGWKRLRREFGGGGGRCDKSSGCWGEWQRRRGREGRGGRYMYGGGGAWSGHRKHEGGKGGRQAIERFCHRLLSRKGRHRDGPNGAGGVGGKQEEAPHAAATFHFRAGWGRGRWWKYQ
jgi:hypothetical protein